jgi:hypothetical protein
MIHGIVRNKDGALDDMIVSTLDRKTYKSRSKMSAAEFATLIHFDSTRNPHLAKPALGAQGLDAVQAQLEICKAFDDERGCLYPCMNKYGKASKRGDKAHVCDAIIPVMPQWVLDIPAAERIEKCRVVHIKYKCCASTNHTRMEHFDHHDGIIKTIDGAFVWFMDLSTSAEGTTGADRWAGVM